MKKALLVLLLLTATQSVSAMGRPMSVFAQQKVLQSKIQTKQSQVSNLAAPKLLANQDFDKNEVVSFLTKISRIFMKLLQTWK